MRHNTECDFTFDFPDMWRMQAGILLDFVSGEAITLHVYVLTLNTERHAWNPNDGGDPNADATDHICTYIRDVKLAAAKQSMEQYWHDPPANEEWNK